MEIAHCGDCGQCSTDSDIELMIATKDTLTKDATSCAVRGLLFGDEKIDACLQTIGFTPGCAVSIFVRSIYALYDLFALSMLCDCATGRTTYLYSMIWLSSHANPCLTFLAKTCWKENILCTIKNCVFTCLKSKLLANTISQKLITTRMKTRTLSWMHALNVMKRCVGLTFCNVLVLIVDVSVLWVILKDPMKSNALPFHDMRPYYSGLSSVVRSPFGHLDRRHNLPELCLWLRQLVKKLHRVRVAI